MSTMKRRDVLKFSAIAAAAAMLPGTLLAQDPKKGGKAGKPLNILILGGTGFLGPHIVEAAQKRGHTLTLFNRGKTNPGLFPDVEKLHGDRKTDMTALHDRKWDAVVDTSGYFPADVKRSAELLKPNVGRYVFISTISVYESMAKPNDETSPVGKTSTPDATEITGETYGPLKALCEEEARKAFPDSSTIIRPGLIVGPGDPTDRFTYWPARVARGGEVLAPDKPEHPTQFIDGRDLAAFIVTCLENETNGTFNADAQAGSLTMGALLDSCKRMSKSDATFTWVPWKFLEAQNVNPWSDLPAWIPAEGDSAGFGKVDASKAKAAGLTYRPLDETVKDTLAWMATWPAERKAKLRAGLSPEREAEVLKAWHAKEAG